MKKLLIFARFPPSIIRPSWPGARSFGDGATGAEQQA
jgi:hypothetical protein